MGCCGIVECYNFEVDRWDYCVSLNNVRCKSGFVIVKGYIYIVGGGSIFGDFGGSIFLSVEKYNLDEDFWLFVVSMKEVRLYLGCVYYYDKIFVIGGIDLSGF